MISCPRSVQRQGVATMMRVSHSLSLTRLPMAEDKRRGREDGFIHGTCRTSCIGNEDSWEERNSNQPRWSALENEWIHE
jgi:hypothetical protein